MATGLLPLLAASRAAACRVESMPGVTTGTRPHIGGSRLPFTFRASDFYFGHGSCLY